MRRPVEERFWEKVDKSGSCWVWTGSRSPSGYGRFYNAAKRVFAHRLSYEMSNGAIPSGLVIDHVCHNHSCVNPSHLRAATIKQNQEHRAGATSVSSTGIRGVGLAKREGKWRGAIGHNHRYIHVGYFDSLEAAEAAVVAKRLELFTHNDADKKAA